MNEVKKIEKELSLSDLWFILIRNLKSIIFITLVIFIITIIYTWFIVTPEYISNGDVMVQVEQDSSSNVDSNFDLVNAFRLIDTVAELMEKEIILENAKLKLIEMGYNEITVKNLRDGLSVSSSATSYFINISFIDENELLSKDAVNAIIDAVIEETDILDAFPVLTNKIRRTSFASDSEYYSPNKLIFAFFGMFLGLGVSIGYVLLKEAISTKYRSRDEVEADTQFQILGVIPSMTHKEIKNVKIKK